MVLCYLLLPIWSVSFGEQFIAYLFTEFSHVKRVSSTPKQNFWVQSIAGDHTNDGDWRSFNQQFTRINVHSIILKLTTWTMKTFIDYRGAVPDNNLWRRQCVCGRRSTCALCAWLSQRRYQFVLAYCWEQYHIFAWRYQCGKNSNGGHPHASYFCVLKININIKQRLYCLLTVAWLSLRMYVCLSPVIYLKYAKQTQIPAVTAANSKAV